MRTALRQTFAALEVPHFRILWVSTILALVGFFMSTVAQSVVAFNLTGANTAVGLVVFAQGVMMFTLGPLGGAFADRLPKRRVIAAGQLSTALVFLSIAFALATGKIAVTWLVIGSLVMGSSFAFLGPARQSLAVEIVGPNRRGNAIALTQVANAACRVLGPALAGALLAAFENGALLAYLVMSVFYCISASSLLWLPRSKVRDGARDRHVVHDLLDGLRYVRDHPRLGSIMLLFTLVTITGFPHITILPGFVENQLGAPAESSSVLFAASAFGALLAALTVARFADAASAPRIFSTLALGFGASLALAAWSPSFPAITAMMVLAGVLSGGFQTLAGAVIVRLTEPHYVGRVSSLMMMSFAGFGLMGLPIGYLADLIGERGAFLAMGIAVVLVSLLLRSRVARPLETSRLP